ncbi:hypothetical protein Tco_0578137 [Tanacetum coccineum]
MRKCPDHRILLLDQILTFYHGIMMIDQERFMWDAEVYYDTTTDMGAHYSKTTFESSEQVEVLGNDTGYTIQSVQHNPGLGSGYQQKDRKPSQNDKTEHGMEKTVQNQGQSPKMTKVQSILEESSVKTVAGTDETI